MSHSELERELSDDSPQWNREMITNLTDRVASLESDIEQLRELLKALVDNNGGMVSQIEHWEITNALSTWANGDD